MLYAVMLGVLSATMSYFGFRGRENVVGVDLGTTFSAVAMRRHDGSVEVIRNKHGSNTTPSVVGYPKGGHRVLVGAGE